MEPGVNIRQEAGKVAGSAVDALRGNPLCLAVVVLTIVLSLIAYYRDRGSQAEKAQIVNTLIERCMGPSKR
jgi:hypothetical protein